MSLVMFALLFLIFPSLLVTIYGLFYLTWHADNQPPLWLDVAIEIARVANIIGMILLVASLLIKAGKN